MQLEHVSCDLCGSGNYRVRYTKPDNWLRGSLFQFPVVECLECGLVFVNPRPTPKEMINFYPVGYHDNRDTPDYIQRYSRQQRFLPALQGKKVLDIGCARGDFLSYLLGINGDFQAYGVDAYSDYVNDSRIQFTSGSLFNNSYDSETFDLITAWAVFEHLQDPMAHFKEAARLLKRGGEMIILVTNADSLYGKSAYAEDIPRHTYHFSAQTVKKYGQLVGLDVISITYSDDIFDGRGTGTIAYALGKLAGFTWEKEMLGSLSYIAKAALLIGSLMDRVLFFTHWEATLKRSGIMVAKYVKRG